MENSIKKPPIVLDERRPVEKKPGDLTYAEKPKRDGKKGFSPGGINWTQILLPVVIALVLAAGMLFQFAPTKGEFESLEKDFSSLQSQMGITQGDVGKNKGLIDTITTNQGDFAKKTDIVNFASIASVEALAVLPDQIDTKFGTLEASYETRIAGLEAKVTELEEEAATTTTDGTTSYDGVTVEVSTPGGMDLVFEPFGVGQEQKGTIKVRVVNGTGRDIEDIELLAVFAAYNPLPKLLLDPVLSGTPAWTYHPQSTINYLVFTTGWASYGTFDLDAGKSKTLYPSLILKAEDSSSTTVYFEVEITCEGFEYAD